MKNIFLFLSLTAPILLSGQIQFSDSSHLVSDSHYFTYLSKGVADINNDGLDDIVRSRPVLATSTGSLMVAYQRPDGSFIQDSIGRVSQITQLSTVVGDLDRNGFNDIICGGAYDGVHVMMNHGGTFNLVELDTPAVFVQGTNLADINGDGWLDYFACHDEDISQIWANNGSGTLSPVSNWINMSTMPVSDNSGNYGSVWTDFDNDGDLDLYIAKCRAGVTDPADPQAYKPVVCKQWQRHFHRGCRTIQPRRQQPVLDGRFPRHRQRRGHGLLYHQPHGRTIPDT